MISRDIASLRGESKEQGCNRTGSCTAGRTTFAVEFLERGGAFDNLQVLLGHADIATLRYVR